MSVFIDNITVACDDVALVSSFWAAALELALDPKPSEYFASINHGGADLPRFLFIGVPETKSAKNRMHLDLLVEGSAPRAEEVVRLVELGATHVADKDEWGHSWAVLTDPEGNEFCVVAKH